MKGRIEVAQDSSFTLDVDDDRVRSVVGLSSFLYCFPAENRLLFILSFRPACRRGRCADRTAAGAISSSLKPFEPISMMLERCRARTRTLQGKASQPTGHVAVAPLFPISTQAAV